MTSVRAKPLSFLPKPRIEYGGSNVQGRRKIRRPFNPKIPLHLTLRSSKARGERSLLRSNNKRRVHALLNGSACRYEIRILRFANVGNHVHLLIQARRRSDLQGFLREFAGAVAMMATGAVKGNPEKFWDGLAWSKMVEWGRQFENTARYILLNVLEGAGKRDRSLLSRLERDGIIIVSPEPGS